MSTKVVDKNESPLIIRRYSRPITYFVAIISDDKLSNLDETVSGFWKDNPVSDDIQAMRNRAGSLSDLLVKTYEKAEGVAVIFVADKLTISSLWGDFMNHAMCRQELYFLLNFATGV